MRFTNALSLLMMCFLIGSCESKTSPVAEENCVLLLTDSIFHLSGISLSDSFDLEQYIQVLGKPDSIIRGGPSIVEEFGVDDYDLYYGHDWLTSGHGYLLNANILSSDISVNTLKVGNQLKDIERVFGLEPIQADIDCVILNNDTRLEFRFDNQQYIEQISFSAPL